jgi:uncharacterized membrane protein HdeD (DUF308 family)
MFANALSRYWWVALLRGLVAILFGIVAFALPGVTLATLVLFFAAFAFVEGILAVVSAVGARKSDETWWVLFIEGLFGVAFGVLTFMRPAITGLVLLLYIAAWAIVTGALRIAAAIRLRKEIEGEGWLALGGVVSILFGVFMFAFPAAGALAVLFYIGAWSIVTGVTLCLLSFELRRLGKLGPGERGPREVPTFGTRAPAR